MEQAFQKAKIALSEAAILAHLQSEPEMSLAVDASNHHVGRVLQVWIRLATAGLLLQKAECCWAGPSHSKQADACSARQQQHVAYCG